MRNALDGIRALSRTARTRLASLIFLLAFTAVGNAWSSAPTVQLDLTAAPSGHDRPALVQANVIDDIIDWFTGDDDDDTAGGDGSGSGGSDGGGSDGDW